MTDASEGKWISVEERLPDINLSVLLYDPNYQYMFTAYRMDPKHAPTRPSGRRDIWSDGDNTFQAAGVTHWRHLPEPPK